MRFRLHRLLLTGFLFACLPVAAQPDALLTGFVGGHNVTRQDARRIRAVFRDELTRRNRFTLVSDARLHAELNARGIAFDQVQSVPAASLTLARLMEIPTVMTGQIHFDAGRYVLQTWLIDAQAGRILRTAYSTADTLDVLLTDGPEHNLNLLLDMSPAAVDSDSPLSWRTSAATGMAALEQRWQQFRDLADGRLQVGTRSTAFLLTRPDKDTFLGSIDRLEAQQNLWPLKGFLRWLLSPVWAVDLAWDGIRATTRTTDIGHSNGDLLLAGPILSGVARRTFTRHVHSHTYQITPYAGGGLAYFFGDFDHDPVWFHGFGRSPRETSDWPAAQREYQAWLDEGAPDWPNSGYRRTLKFDHALGLVLNGGCQIQFHRHWFADVHLRYVHMESDATFSMSWYGEVFERVHATFPLNHWTAGVGIGYAF